MATSLWQGAAIASLLLIREHTYLEAKINQGNISESCAPCSISFCKLEAIALVAAGDVR